MAWCFVVRSKAKTESKYSNEHACTYVKRFRLRLCACLGLGLGECSVRVRCLETQADEPTHTHYIEMS
jgi:hypothetical protein